MPRKLISISAAIWLMLGISDLLSGQEIITEYYTSNHVMHKKYFECMDLTLGDMVVEGKGNPGILGRVISTIFSKITGEVGAVVIMMALFVLCLFIFHGIEFMAALRKRNAYKQQMEDTYEEISSKEDYKAPSYRVIPQPSIRRQQARDNGHAMQSVNLMEMNMTLDEIEENKRKQAIGKNTMEEIVAGNKKPGKKEKPAIKKPEEAVIPGIVDEKVPVNDENNIVQKQETDDERRKRNIENIPVFRDELNKKFGRKRNTVQEISQEPLFTIKDTAEYIETGMPEKVTEPEDFNELEPENFNGLAGFSADNFSTDNIEDSSNSVNDNIILVKAPEDNNSAETASNDARQELKPQESMDVIMQETTGNTGETASSNMEEDIRDAAPVMDSSTPQAQGGYAVKQEESKTVSQKESKSEVSSAPAYKRPETTTNHGRIIMFLLLVHLMRLITARSLQGFQNQNIFSRIQDCLKYQKSLLMA